MHERISNFLARPRLTDTWPLCQGSRSTRRELVGIIYKTIVRLDKCSLPSIQMRTRHGNLSNFSLKRPDDESFNTLTLTITSFRYSIFRTICSSRFDSSRKSNSIDSRSRFIDAKKYLENVEHVDERTDTYRDRADPSELPSYRVVLVTESTGTNGRRRIV